MRLAFNIGSVKTNEMNLENINVEVAFNPNELKENYDTVKTVIKELPAVIKDLKTAESAVNTAEQELSVTA